MMSLDGELDSAQETSLSDAEDSQEDSSADSDDSSSSSRPLGWRVPGMQTWDPEFYNWVASRMGTRTKVFLVLSFMSLEGGKSILAERAYVQGVNTFSILVVTNLVSLIFALWLSLMLEGGSVMHKLLRLHPLVRFMGISFLFTFASVLVLLAYRIGTPPAEVVTIGYIYMPISAVLSYYVFRRRYGMLEWLSVGMMSLAVLAFVLLREESKDQTLGPGFSIQGFGLVVGAVAISVSASILAERAFKEQSLCMIRNSPQRQTKFYIMKVHLDFSSLIISICLWLARTILPHIFDDFFEQWSHSKDWFGTWGIDQFYMVIVAAAQGWAAGLVTKEFSTVIKAIVQTLSVVLVMLMEDKIMGNRFHFLSREVPSYLLAIILVMAAVIFQTGRINLKVLRKAANLDAEAHPEVGMAALAVPEGGERPEAPSNSRRSSDSSTLRERTGSKDLPRKDGNSSKLEWQQVSKPQPPQRWESWKKLFTTYALILVYICSDAGRTLILQKAMQTTVINSTSMGLVCYICGSVVASILSLKSHGFQDGLFTAWSPRKIVHCLPAAFLFALATALGNMSFAMGINSALYVVLGKFYTPVAALGARWIMGKFYIWLEWFAILILTLASIVFGYLQAFGVQAKGEAGAPLSAMVCVLLSAATSAFASLVTEKILKGEGVPFHMQKVRLDVGSIMSSMVLLPAIGFIATRAQDIPWEKRPWNQESCPAESVCWDLKAGGCGNTDCHCECTSGVFAGWDNLVLLVAVFINTAQGWLVGKVTQQFSVIHRAIADSFSLLAIYFIGDPIFNHTSLSNVGLNLVAFIVPVSTATFSVATSEMQKVFNARARIRGRRNGRSEEETDNMDSDMEESEDLSELSPAISRNISRYSEGSPVGTQSPGSPLSQVQQDINFRPATDGAWME